MYVQDIDMFKRDMKTILSAGLDMMEFCPYHVPHEATYPETQDYDQIEPEIDLENCNGCGMCANCIHGGISMRDDEPQTHLDLCVGCGVCESICPSDAIAMQVQ
jgi:Pyruvate/2-oxoacid:ferredoxin oxidoreductase delta subunit